MNKKVVELESTKARLKVLERNSDHSSNPTPIQKPPRQTPDVPPKGAQATPHLPLPEKKKVETPTRQQPGEDNFSRYQQQPTLQQKAESRVHFDLNNLPKTVGAPRPPKQLPLTSPNVTVVEGLRSVGQPVVEGLRNVGQPAVGRKQTTLPSDARQRLEEMANSARLDAGMRKYSVGSNIQSRIPTSSKSHATSPRRESGDPVQELIANRFNYPPSGVSQNNNNSKPPTRRESTPAMPSGLSSNGNGLMSSRERSLNQKNSEPSTPLGVSSAPPSKTPSTVTTPTMPPTNSVTGSALDLDASKKVRPKSFWANWWRF